LVVIEQRLAYGFAKSRVVPINGDSLARNEEAVSSEVQGFKPASFGDRLPQGFTRLETQHRARVELAGRCIFSDQNRARGAAAANSPVTICTK